MYGPQAAISPIFTSISMRLDGIVPRNPILHFWFLVVLGPIQDRECDGRMSCDALVEVASVVDDRLAYSNQARCHSTLDYKRPEEVLLRTLKRGNIAEES